MIIEHFLNIPLVKSLATTDWNLFKGNITISPINNRNVKLNTNYNVKINDNKQFNFLFPDDVDIKTIDLPNDAILNRIRPMDFNETEAEVILELKDLQVIRDKHRIEWKNKDGKYGLSLKIYRGEVVVLRAANGWGKTTLVETISGEIPRLSGDIIFLGEYFNKNLYSYKISRKGLQVVHANNNLFTNITGNEMLKLAKANNKIVNIKELLDRPINQLSGGERQRIALATMQNTKKKHLIVYDEPFTGLDAKSVSLFEQMFHPDFSNAKIILIP